MPELVSEVVISFDERLNANSTSLVSESARVRIALSFVHHSAGLCPKFQLTSNSALASWSRILGCETSKFETLRWHLGMTYCALLSFSDWPLLTTHLM